MNYPPSIIAGLYVIEYALADETVTFEQRYTLNVDGEWLGRVPKLVICKPFDKDEYMVQYCSEEWDPLGIASGYESVIEAKDSVERSYNGISDNWKPTNNKNISGHSPFEKRRIYRQ